MSSRNLWWLIAASLGGLLYLELWSRRAPEVAMLHELGAAPFEPALDAVAAPARQPLAAAVPEPVAAPAPTQTAREFLAQYYGARWREIEPKLTAKGLDEPYHMTPWEQVQPEFARQVGLVPEHRAAIVHDSLRWTDELSAAWLHDEFPLPGWDGALDESDLVAIETMVAPLHEEIRARAEHLAERTDVYLQEMWQRGTYLRAPFTTLGLSEQAGYHSQSLGGYGWALSFTLTREACPDIGPLEDEILALCGQRDGLVVSYLRSRLRR